MAIQTVGVLGAGTMGNGIAQVFAQHGLTVHLVDKQPLQLDAALASIDKSLTKFVEKDKITEDIKAGALGRLHTHTELKGLAECDLVVEAVTENEATKIALFKQVDDLCPEHTILASNTSAISLTRMAAATSRPSQFVGMHFMNPVPLMKLVELIRARQTSDETYQAIHLLSEEIGKVPVTAGDYPGFVSNRILMPMINEAIFTLYEGVATAEDIDTVMQLGMNHPMGPLKLADMIGLDTCLFIMKVLYEGFNDPKYRPCPLLQQMVDAGYTGRKNGRGFYSYD
ncbi:3-hydroxybutyryl-CoA dehydrogenase [Saccharospirillum salsuginis]|uniref:3-hydroxybutyryl-CoA dehydrogenase n=1 Tax=Saccharospirillum salsuginis TaxID=418750 RepID=A0A918KR64_9GAMM|nr:3-hydroxybutyryl-CoA dehydrogenase [Saccharospirillum salsuginis]GGX73656.1 3-hydroxybutyryl-CoA dehydrogenase [Saccharospirillum salsuginis]